MALTVLLSVAFLATNLASFGSSPLGWVRALTVFSVNRSIELMLGVFLILGICRCLVHFDGQRCVMVRCSVFAVLLLIMLVQREPIAVLEFLVWAVLTAILLSLDHRRESRRGLSGSVASVVPGQDVKLSARSLATIITVSLSCSVALSYTLAVTDSDSRGAFEQFIRVVMGGLGRVSSEGNNDSPTTQEAASQNLIDYRSGPPLPTRTVLWRMQARVFSTRRDAQGKRVLNENNSKIIFLRTGDYRPYPFMKVLRGRRLLVGSRHLDRQLKR
jgi:hypothetical protein